MNVLCELNDGRHLVLKDNGQLYCDGRLIDDYVDIISLQKDLRTEIRGSSGEPLFHETYPVTIRVVG